MARDDDVYSYDLTDLFEGCVFWQVIFSFSFVATLCATVVLKEYMIRPSLEKYLKRTHAERLLSKKRKYRDMLQDPFLALQLEESFLRRPDIDGDRSKMLQAMQALREKAEDNDNGNNDDDGGGGVDRAITKGQEKKEAAEKICMAIIALSIPGFFSLNMVYIFGFMQSPERQAYAYDPEYDFCAGYGPIVSFFLFCLIHLTHSYWILKKTWGRKKQLPSTVGNRSSASSTVSSSLEDLEQPLIDSVDK